MFQAQIQFQSGGSCLRGGAAVLVPVPDPLPKWCSLSMGGRSKSSSSSRSSSSCHVNAYDELYITVYVYIYILTYCIYLLLGGGDPVLVPYLVAISILLIKEIYNYCCFWRGVEFQFLIQFQRGTLWVLQSVSSLPAG